jgi:uncharacterized protein (TIGR03437 family)
VNATAGSDSIFVVVIPTATLVAAPTTLQFAAAVGGAAPAAQSIQITNSGSGTLAWTATASDPWISLSAASGTAPSTLSVTVSAAGMAAGVYTGSVQIAAPSAANSPESIGVTLTVSAATPTLSVAPQSLTFQYANGGAVPGAQNVAISNTGGGTLAWTASTSAYWLVASAASGNAPATLSVSVNPVNLGAGTYTGTVQVQASGGAGSPAPVSVTLVVTGSPPAPAITSVANGATFQPGFAAATWVSIFGANLSQVTYSWQNTDFVNGALPTSIEGVSVTIDGVAAYVAYISPMQINVLAPDDATNGNVQVQVMTSGQTSNSLAVPKTQFAPSFFTFNGTYVAARHADYSLVGAPNLLSGVVTTPAQPGETILLFGTGFGPTNPPLPTSQLVTTAEPLANPVQITIGGMPATVVFGGLAGPGLYQFNVTVPSLPNGDAAVLATVSGVTSQTGVSVTVQQ